MPKRSTKFYFQNEKEVMRRLGLEPTEGSGSGWLSKEDGQSEHIIAQLKSTDNESIKVNLKDVHTLEYNAILAHKIPVFMIQFLQSNELFIMVKPADLPSVAKYLKTGSYDIIPSKDENIPCDIAESEVQMDCRVIRSSSKDRLKFNKAREEAFKCQNKK